MVGLFIMMFMNGETQKDNIKWVAFGTSIVAFVASVLMWVNFDPSIADLQMVQRNTWAITQRLSEYAMQKPPLLSGAKHPVPPSLGRMGDKVVPGNGMIIPPTRYDALRPL